ncbi:MAG: SDR family NAD(P)-dependent oxidoreductase, partial [bacterium]
MRDGAAVAAAIAGLEGDLGPCERLVTSAGVYRAASILDLDVEAWLDMLRIHVGGTTHAVRAVLPGMLARRSGAIVCIGSELGVTATPPGSISERARGAVELAIAWGGTADGQPLGPHASSRVA